MSSLGEATTLVSFIELELEDPGLGFLMLHDLDVVVLHDFDFDHLAGTGHSGCGWALIIFERVTL